DYPGEGISKILQNVFDFDQYDQASKELLIEIFEKHGIPVGLDSEFTMALGDIIDIGEPILTEKWTRVNKNKAEAKVEIHDIAIRGGWDLETDKKWKDLERKEGRSNVFSEQLYHFEIPTRGEALDIAAEDDGTLYVVTTSPVTLHKIEPNHYKIDSIDLYEYFPLQRTPPRLRISMVKNKQGQLKYVALHNPSNNELLCCNFNEKKVVSLVIRDLEPHPSIMCRNLGSTGVLVFYQYDLSTVAVLDFNTSKQYTIRLPVRINQLIVAEHGLWIARGSRDGITYAVYSAEDGQLPTIMEPIQVLGQNGHNVGAVSNAFGSPNLAVKLLQHPKADRFASVAEGWTREQFLNGPGVINVASYFDASRANVEMPAKVLGNALFLERTQQLAIIQPSFNGRPETTLDILNPSANQVWRIRLPISTLGDGTGEIANVTALSHFQVERIVASMCELSNGNLVTMDNAGTVRIFQVNANELYQSATTWKQMVGVDQKALSVIYESDQKSQDGMQDPTNEAKNGSQDGNGSDKCDGGDGKGSGGNQGTGDGEGGQGSGGQGAGGGGFNGSGGRDNEGGREEATFEDINNLKLKTAGDVPENVSEAQKELHDHAMVKMLEKIKMNRADYDIFQGYMENVRREIRELRVILESVEAKNKERVWLKNQASGDLDDTKIIEGLTGERAIYKKRGDDDPEIGLFQEKPKRMNFVFDLSASMFRFNTHDRRLERSMEVALMLMEAFRGFETKFAYRIIGHSGDGANIEFVKPGNYPKTEKDEFDIISKMRAHSQYCLSGDNTLGAAAHSIKQVVEEEGDDYFVVVLSDANITQYNIHPKDIARVLKSDDRVTSQMIFIGSIQDQAEQLKKALGSHAHICVENKELPKIIKSLFLASMVKA
ncbi:hypothetical protein BJ944DRAFT_233592, partial [Cunninghamella echinulata]